MSHNVMNAGLMDDDVLRESLMNELEAVLERLRSRHGDHPVLIETAADFERSELKQRALYRTALNLAEENRLPTVSIRLSLARLLLEYFHDANQAEYELLTCEKELLANADAYDLAEWTSLLSECRK